MAGDVSFLIGYVSSAAALVGVGGLRGRRQRVAALDAGLLTVGLGVLAWVLVVSKVTAAPAVAAADRVVSTAYPLLGVLLLAVTARLLFAGARGARSRLVLLWVVSQGIADTVYALSVIDGTFAFGGSVFGLWLVGYAALAAAALVPPGVPSAEPVTTARAARRSRTGHLVVAAAILPLPALLVARAVQGSSDDVVLIATGSLLMTFLAIARGAMIAGFGATPAARVAVRRSVLRSTAGFVVLALLPIAGLSYVAVTESQRTGSRRSAAGWRSLPRSAPTTCVSS